MELWVRCSWLLVVLLYGSGVSSSLVRHRRQSSTWWRSNQPAQGSSRGLGQSPSGVGSSRANPWSRAQSVSGLGAPRAIVPVYGWGSRYPAGNAQSRQLPQPMPSSSSSISVQCTNNSMVVMVNRDFYGNGFLVDASDLSLGSCSPGIQSSATVVVFDNDVEACGSSLQMTPNFMIYSTTLIYDPISSNSVIIRASPAMVPISCYYPRQGNVSSNAIRPTWSPFSTTVSTEERLVFSMYLMTDDWSARRSSSIYQLGDVFNIEALVVIDNHIPMLLFVDYCLATTSSDVNSNPSYQIIAFNGCLVDGTQADSSSAFRSPRSEPNMIQFTIDAFRFIGTAVSTIYISCSLRAMEASQPPDPMNKACSYDKTTGSWSAVEGSNDICRCCQSENCPISLGQPRSWDTVYGRSRGIVKREVGPHPEDHTTATLGPLLVISAETRHVESTAEHVKALRVPEQSRPLELWMLVAVGSAGVVFVAVGLAGIVQCVVKRLSAQEPL